MLKTIRLQNFRKHEDLTVHFAPGINAIRAANESGKSTLIEAIAYALFGARALKEGLEDVVTYDVPASKLKVELEFDHAGVSYKLVRGKSGAELNFIDGALDGPTLSGGHVVTGQTEVTKYIERLLGTAQDMAGKLMLARQKDLGGALAEGPTAAGKMIEDLANLDLIDQLLQLITANLPAGKTAAMEGMIEGLRVQGTPDLTDLAPLESAVQSAQIAFATAEDAHRQLRAEYDSYDVVQANEILHDAKVLGTEVEITRRNSASAQERAAAPLPREVPQSEIDAAYAEVEQEKEYGYTLAVHKELTAARIEELWDRDLKSLNDEITEVATNIAKLEKSIAENQAAAHASRREHDARQSDWAVEIAALKGKIIKEESCAFCGKDLRDVPEVVLHNNPIFARMNKLGTLAADAKAEQYDEQLKLASTLQELNQALNQAIAYRLDLEAVVKANEGAERLYAKCERYITVDRSVVPGRWTWTGPVISGERPDVKARLSRLQAESDAYTRAVAARTSAESLLAEATAHLASLEARLAALPVADAQDTLYLAADLKLQVDVGHSNVQTAQEALSQAQQELATAKAVNAARQAEAARAAANLRNSEAVLAEMLANNALIDKLRKARPVITDRLWGMVLAAVSSDAAAVRGEQSIVTRAEGKFKINGRPVTGLSGSAEDVLGLAIRFALTKLFLPNVDFLILDEAAAACDDARETAMLGLLASAGFKQTILVTHSPLADAFADNIITF